MEKYTLEMPQENEYMEDNEPRWYIGTEENKSMYLRQSMEILDSTGYDTDNSGYWETYEEALKAKQDYEKKQLESELVFPAYYMYIGDGTGHEDILYCRTKDDCKLVYTIDKINTLSLGTELTIYDWSQMKYVSISSAEWFGLTEHLKVSTDVFNDFGKMNTHAIKQETKRGDGTNADYYKLPEGATELKHLIKYKHMEHGIGEAFCALYRLNDNDEYIRNLKKAKSYIDDAIEYAEMELEKL